MFFINDTFNYAVLTSESLNRRPFLSMIDSIYIEAFKDYSNILEKLKQLLFYCNTHPSGHED